jgi:EmrB/QacA subfamily drug resistance transporter
MKTRASVAVGVACAAQFLIGVDGLGVAIALPAVQRAFAAPPVDAQWVLTAYGLAFGGGLLLCGRLGDLYGRRRLLVAGMALFTAGALIAGLARSLGVLIAARAVQGAGSAAAVPAALALIGSLFGPGRERTRALAILAATASVGTTTGLLLGGAVTQWLGWRWVFLVMVVPAALAVMAAPRVLPEARARDAGGPPDVPGAVLATAGLLSLLFGFTRVERDGVTAPTAFGPALVGLALLCAFAIWERRAPAPIVRPGVLRDRGLRAATLGAGLNAISFTAIVYACSLYLQTELGYAPLEASASILPLDVVAFAITIAGAAIISRRSPRALLAVAFAASALALLWLARAPDRASYVRDVLGPLVVLGVSLPLAFVVLTQQAVAGVEPDDRGMASGIFETANHLFGGAVGVALYATVIAAAGGYGAAFAVAAGLAAAGLVVARIAPSDPGPSRP